MPARTDVFTGVAICSHPSCQWDTGEGWSGILAKYSDEDGQPACFSHRAEESPEDETD